MAKMNLLEYFMKKIEMSFENKRRWCLMGKMMTFVNFHRLE